MVRIADRGVSSHPSADFLTGIGDVVPESRLHKYYLWHLGFEASRDLVINTPWTWEMQRMAFATRHLGAIQLTMAKGLGLTADESDAVQRDIDGERYVPGGYCEAGGPRRSLVPREPFSVEVLPRQLDYLVDATAIAREHGAKVVWVTHPFPRDHREALLNYDEVHADIDQTAEEAKVPSASVMLSRLLL